MGSSVHNSTCSPSAVWRCRTHHSGSFSGNMRGVRVEAPYYFEMAGASHKTFHEKTCGEPQSEQLFSSGFVDQLKCYCPLCAHLAGPVGTHTAQIEPRDIWSITVILHDLEVSVKPSPTLFMRAHSNNVACGSAVLKYCPRHLGMEPAVLLTNPDVPICNMSLVLLLPDDRVSDFSHPLCCLPLKACVKRIVEMHWSFFVTLVMLTSPSHNPGSLPDGRKVYHHVRSGMACRLKVSVRLPEKWGIVVRDLVDTLTSLDSKVLCGPQSMHCVMQIWISASKMRWLSVIINFNSAMWCHGKHWMSGNDSSQDRRGANQCSNIRTLVD